MIARILPSILIPIIVMTGAFASPLYRTKNPFTISPDFNFASHSDGLFSPASNPVFADDRKGPMLSYRYFSYDGKTAGDHFAMGRAYGFSFIYSWLGSVYMNDSKKIEESGANCFSIDKGFFIKDDMLGIGAGYSFSSSENRRFKGYRSWRLGLVFRPFRYVSLGATLNDLWGEINGNSLNMREVYSLSVRPLTEKLTLSFDATRESGRKITRFGFRTGLEMRLFYGISVYARYERSGNFIFGMQMPLFIRSGDVMGGAVEFHKSYVRDGGKDFYTFAAGYPSARYESSPVIAVKKNYLKIKLSSRIRENTKRGFFGDRALSFYDYVHAVRRAAEDDTIHGLILQIDGVGLGFSQVQELRSELKNFRKNGKTVHAIMTASGNREYYLASAADRIYFTPNSSFYLTGLKAEVYFFKGLFDKIGVRIESFSAGRYKSYNERFTRERMSDAYRENLMSVLSDMNEQFIGDIAADRGLEKSRVKDLVGRGIMSGDDAVKAGFIDEVCYHDEASRKVSSGGGVIRIKKYSSEKTNDFVWGRRDTIAVVHVSGSIERGRSTGSFFGPAIGDEDYRGILDEVFKDESVKAVVIRVSSGGGSSAASDFMWNHLVMLKKKHKKPVVFSFGDIAASGGYYIALTGDRIYSGRGTLTGSIGVVYGKLSLKRLFEKIGITRDVVKMSEYADIFSFSRDLTEKEKALVQSEVDFIYGRFIDKVAESRKIPKEKLPEIAEGRIFSGSQGKAKGMLDEIGGLMVAVEYAKTVSGIGRDYRVKMYPDESFALTDLLELPEIRNIAGFIGTVVKKAIKETDENERVYYMYPYMIDIK